jgi:hypothetical protein
MLTRLKTALLTVLLPACGVTATPGPSLRPQDLPPDAALPAEVEVLPQLASSTKVSIYAQLLQPGVASYSSELSFALGDGYPAQITVTPTDAVYVVSRGCRLDTLPTAVWTSLVRTDGDAAGLALAGGVLTVDLKKEGAVTAVLEGELQGLHCTIDGAEVTSLPLHHELTLHVERVSGFFVQHLAQIWPGCDGPTMVLPEGLDFELPQVHPLNGAGGRFHAENAPAPVRATLRSAGGLVSENHQWHLTSGAGQVTVTLDSPLPVTGVQTFEVVRPGSLSSLTAAVYLTVTASKGVTSRQITDGETYPVFFPTQPNTVDIKVDAAATEKGAALYPDGISRG